MTLLASKQNWLKFEMPALQKIPGHGVARPYFVISRQISWSRLSLFANGLKRVNIICGGICLLQKYANVSILSLTTIWLSKV